MRAVENIQSIMGMLLSFILVLAFNTAAKAESQGPQYSIKDIPISTWEKLAQKNIYFGHHSVGENILEGIKDLMKEYPQIKLNIINVDNHKPELAETPAFAHSKVGRNLDPKSKIHKFKELLHKGLGDNTDIAFFKFCFVDFDPRTDIDDVFYDYRETMNSLTKRYPKTTFVHFTVPLTCYPPGIEGFVRRGKDWMKKILGKENIYDHSSSKFFNERIRKEYAGKEPLFDIAKIESTEQDGKRATFVRDGIRYNMLLEEYTDDGGHLNDKGRKIVAEQLLVYLAKLVEE